jgi:uncharacterized protein (DUF2062 family)
MRKYFKRVTPGRERIHQMLGDGAWQRRFGGTLLHPKLWHLTRRTAAGGVAVGLFCGLIPGPLQMLGAALMALLFRVNLPLALVVTLYTNPLTIVPLYVLAFTLGQWVIGNGRAGFVAPPEFDWATPLASMQALVDWVIALGPPLGVGLPLMAILFALAGYALVWSAWSVHIALYRARRRQRAGAGVKRGSD